MPKLRLTDKKLALLKVDFEAGKMTQGEIAKKHGISVPTLMKYSNKEKWVRQGMRPQVDAAIEKKATERLIEKESGMLFEYTEEYIQNIKKLDVVHRLNLNAYTKELAEKQNMMDHKSALKFKTVQEFLHRSAQTFLLNYNGFRLAMGVESNSNSVHIHIDQDDAKL